MKKGLTEVVFILDESGSMRGLKSDTIGGFNSLLEKQREAKGETLVSVVLFNDWCRVLYDRVPVKEVMPMQEQDYCPRGRTALLDALGGAIQHIARLHRKAGKENSPEHTVFIMTTDGMENASRKYTSGRVKDMVEQEKSRHGWEFIFLGADLDAVETAESYGIGADRIVCCCSDPEGIGLSFDAMDEVINAVRGDRLTGSEWKKRIERDFMERGPNMY